MWKSYPTPQPTRARVDASPEVFSLIIYLDMCPTGHSLPGIRFLAKLDPCTRACPQVPRLWWTPTPTPQLTRARVAASPVVFSLIAYIDICFTRHRVAGVCALAKLIRLDVSTTLFILKLLWWVTVVVQPDPSTHSGESGRFP